MFFPDESYDFVDEEDLYEEEVVSSLEKKVFVEEKEKDEQYDFSRFGNCYYPGNHIAAHVKAEGVILLDTFTFKRVSKQQYFRSFGFTESESGTTEEAIRCAVNKEEYRFPIGMLYLEDALGDVKRIFNGSRSEGATCIFFLYEGVKYMGYIVNFRLEVSEVENVQNPRAKMEEEMIICEGVEAVHIDEEVTFAEVTPCKALPTYMMENDVLSQLGDNISTKEKIFVEALTNAVRLHSMIYMRSISCFFDPFLGNGVDMLTALKCLRCKGIGWDIDKSRIICARYNLRNYDTKITLGVCPGITYSMGGLCYLDPPWSVNNVLSVVGEDGNITIKNINILIERYMKAHTPIFVKLPSTMSLSQIRLKWLLPIRVWPIYVNSDRLYFLFCAVETYDVAVCHVLSYFDLDLRVQEGAYIHYFNEDFSVYATGCTSESIYFWAKKGNKKREFAGNIYDLVDKLLVISTKTKLQESLCFPSISVWSIIRDRAKLREYLESRRKVLL